MASKTARRLRKNPTEAEQALWKHLRYASLAHTSFAVSNQSAGTLLINVNFEKRVIIELDGGQHSQQVDYDAERTACLNPQGYRVLRFWNNQVLKEIEAVKAIISKVLEDGVNTPHLNPPPQGGRRDNYRVASGNAES